MGFVRVGTSRAGDEVSQKIAQNVQRSRRTQINESKTIFCYLSVIKYRFNAAMGDAKGQRRNQRFIVGY